MLALVVVFMQDYPVFSIFLVNFQALAMMMTCGLTQPFSTRLAIRMELMNEVFVLLTTYHLYQFTDFLTDLNMRSNVGTSLIVCTIVNVLLNIGVVVISTLALTARKLKLHYLELR